jgi:transposase
MMRKQHKRGLAAAISSIMTAKPNHIDPQDWLADMLGRIANLAQGRLHDMLPLNWSADARPVAPDQAA